MIKKYFIALLCVAAISCQEEKKAPTLTAQEKVTNASYSTELVVIPCDQHQEHTYALPIFASPEGKVLNYPLQKVIAQAIDASPEDELMSLMDQLKTKNTCPAPYIDQLEIAHISQDKSFISFRYSYQQNGEDKALLRTYSKPDLQEIKLTDLLTKEKEKDVKIIFDRNLQRNTALLIKKLPQDQQIPFSDMMYKNVFSFTDIPSIRALPLSIAKTPQGRIIETMKEVDLPETFDQLNENVLIPFREEEIKHYLDLSAFVQ